MAHKKKYCIVCEIIDKNEQQCSTLTFFRHKIYLIQKRCADMDSMYETLMKMNVSNLEKSSIDKVFSKLIDYSLVSNKSAFASLQ